MCGCKTTADCAAKADGNLCNGTLYCDASKVCKVNPATVVKCPTVDDTACSTTLCDGKTGACAPVAIGDGKACDDGNPGTSGDAGKAGSCAASANTCICSADTECAGKDDGDLCNGTLFCNNTNGKCQLNPKTVVVCPTVGDSACKVNTCDGLTGLCAFKNIKQFQGCDADGLVCTLTDTCVDGVCKPGANICECLQDSDCKDDGDLCNGTIYCDKSKPFDVCATKAGSVVQCAELGQPPCSTSKCQASNGKRELVVGLNGLDCDDGTQCTAGDSCAKGKCLPSNQLDCNDNNVCSNDSCNPVKGCVYLSNTATCSDGNACTVGEQCTAGSCKNGKVVACEDGNSCTDDGCDAKLGCSFVSNTLACDAGVCTTGDGCKDSVCVSSQQKVVWKAVVAGSKNSVVRRVVPTTNGFLPLSVTAPLHNPTAGRF